MTQRATKRYIKKSERLALQNVENPKMVIDKGRGFSVNRYLLRLQMLKRGVETFSQLAREMGVDAGALRALVVGSVWRPGMARKIEKFLGVKEGEIFRKDIPLNPPSKEGGISEEGNSPESPFTKGDLEGDGK